MSDHASSSDTSGSSELKAGHPPASENNLFLFKLTKNLILLFLNSESRWDACRCFSSSTNITRR